MNTKALIGTVIETIIKVLVVAAAIIIVFKGATKAYDFGYRVFADEPMSPNNGRTITVGIAQDADIKDIARMLEEKGLIADANLFVVQEFLSAQHNKILPGIYDLNTGMKAAEMLEIMATPAESTSDADTSEVTDSQSEEMLPEELPEENLIDEIEGTEETEEQSGEENQ